VVKKVAKFEIHKIHQLHHSASVAENNAKHYAVSYPSVIRILQTASASWHNSQIFTIGQYLRFFAN
jgi:hypothetical protein